MRAAVTRVASASVAARRAVASQAPLARAITNNARRAAPLAASPLLRKARVGGLLAAGSTGVACAFCSVAAPATTAVPASSGNWPTVTLYQYEPCPYCCKVKAVLDYLRIPYHVVEVNPITKKETQAFTDYKKVPVLRIDDEVVVDSSAIIARLRELAIDRGVQDITASEDDSGVSFEEEEKWRQWVDSKLILMTPPNIYRTVPEALEAFDYCLTEGKFTAWERRLSKYSGAVIMYLVAKRSKKKYGIDDERETLYAALNSWVEAVGDKPFLGGKEPNMADLSVFGVLRAMKGLKTFEDLMQHSSIEPWFTRMTEKVGASSRVSSA